VLCSVLCLHASASASCSLSLLLSFSFTHPSPPPLYTLSLHDALPISGRKIPPPNTAPAPHSPRTAGFSARCRRCAAPAYRSRSRSEEHTSELQSRFDLVCRLLLEKKKTKTNQKKLNIRRSTYEATERR